MDNIVIEKTWHDESESFFEVRIKAKTEIISVYQDCYVIENEVDGYVECILKYIENPKNESQIEFINITGGTNLSMKLLPADIYGHVKIEMNMEIDDNNAHLHHCSFYVNSELGLVEQFAHKIKKMVTENDGYCFALIDEW